MALDKRNIFLENTAETMPYSSMSKPVANSYPLRNIKSHAQLIERKLQEAYKSDITQKQAAAIRYKDGVYLEFFSAPKHDLAIKSLENRPQGIRLLNVHKDIESEITKATIYIPAGKEAHFIKKVEAYASEETKSGNPKNNDLIGSIEDVKLAILDSFWIGDKGSLPASEAVWCEIWLRFDYDRKKINSWTEAEENLVLSCQQGEIHIDENRILFPERIVKLCLANAAQLKILISMCPFISEIRRAQDATTFFQELINTEQQEWCDELLSRTHFLNQSIAICLLDTGLTTKHSLLADAVQPNGVQAVKSEWGDGDHEGHGTEMAGIALYYDLKQALADNCDITIPHKVESVKILPPKGENSPELYGAITEQAVALAEIANPTMQRILCMAVTAPHYNTKDGSPSSWSAAIDNLTSAADDQGEKRLFFISAGNVYPSELSEIEYPDANTLHGIESPGQSWNAITVGAFAKDIVISYETSAVDLCDSNYIAVYPIIGWWRSRAYLGKSNNPIRYSMILSLSTPKLDIDLYTPIITAIKPAIEISIPNKK